MAPNLLGKSASLFLDETQVASVEPVQIISKSTYEYPKPQVQTPKPQTEDSKYKWRIAWFNVCGFLYLHTAGLYGMYLFFFVCSWKTCLWSYFLAAIAGIGVTAGAHRLWAHRAYKAKLPLRIILMLLQTMAFQNHLYEWVRDHRVHHKFTDTDADPHNAQRGFFFSHMGWLMIKKHKDVITKGKTVDLSDLRADPVVTFQRKYYLLMMPILAFVVPAFTPWYFWNEPFLISWHVCAIFRYTLSLHITWLVNSAAHIWGQKPYDKNIGPTENRHVAFWAFGEGWHNYHHVFPWDYKAAELGNYRSNHTTAIIDMLSKIGWAYDLKTVPVELVNKRSERTGDGTREKVAVGDKEDNVEAGHHHHHEDMIWGWGDKDMKEEDIKIAKIFNKID